ncbi:MAG: fibronectin type III domain-containing protein, partial [Cyclobacteriaceae bacterium]|nr:fibronectin type III domain-containing protein [Cyclobacteriaceae bacterium]
MSWIDSNDNLWLFGGVTGLDDLWKFNTSTGNWTWVSGGYNSGIPINYGVLGIEDPSNFPGRRYGGVSWIDESDNLWFFGGMGYDSDNNIGRLNNLWKYNLSSGNWTWMSGNSKRNMPGIYNVKNIPNSENIPGSRAWASATKDSNNKFWLMSGSGYDINGYLTYLTDLWSIEFIPATPANISHRSIGQYEAEFEWDPTIWTDKYIVEVSNDLAFSDIHSTFENLLSNPNSNTLVIQSLSPGTTYYLRLKSENNLGASAFSEIFTFITAPETPSINEVVNIGQEIATVNWSHEIATDSYNVEVSVDTFKTKSIFSVTVNSLQLEGLLPGTNYQVQIQGLNSFGTSPNSMVYHFETTPPNPVCLSATQISQSNFLANWNNTKGAKSYTIDVSDDNYVSYLTGYEGRVTTNLSEIVIGLSPG